MLSSYRQKSELVHFKSSKVCNNLLTSLKGSTAGVFI